MKRNETACLNPGTHAIGGRSSETWNPGPYIAPKGLEAPWAIPGNPQNIYIYTYVHWAVCYPPYSPYIGPYIPDIEWPCIPKIAYPQYWKSLYSQC